jgi:hypothetical protein
LHRVLKPWGEGDKTASVSPGLGTPATLGEATWIQPFFGTATPPWTQPGGLPGEDFASVASSAQSVYGPAESPYDFPSTTEMVADAQTWMDDSGSNHGWVLMSTAESTPKTARRFGSREANIDAPRLRVEFVRPPRIERAYVTGGRMHFEFNAVADQGYRVETNGLHFPAAQWGTLTNIPAPVAPTLVVVEDPVAASPRFYRIAAETP